MSYEGLRYSGKNMEEAKEKARVDNRALEEMGTDARILINTMKWDRSMGRRGPKGVRYYSVEHIGDIDL
ncbi:hypothetical protein KAU33_04485 [Candidatus Dependentiae bacterium]|nr:hypothetical protein [Candidatus Dependentiae bacterium]